MTTITANLTRSGEGISQSVNSTANTLGGFLGNAIVQFYVASQGQEDVVTRNQGMTLFNGDLGQLRTFVVDRWAGHALYSVQPNSADVLSYDAASNLWIPTATDQPVIKKLRVYDDATSAVEVKRVYKSLTHSPAGGSGTLAPVGDHTLTGSVNATYKIVIDSSGTTSWATATFKWSNAPVVVAH
jgi:hypothetical protein